MTLSVQCFYTFHRL